MKPGGHEIDEQDIKHDIGSRDPGPGITEGVDTFEDVFSVVFERVRVLIGRRDRAQAFKLYQQGWLDIDELFFRERKLSVCESVYTAFPVRIAEKLMKLDIKTLADFDGWSQRDLIAQKGVGPDQVAHIFDVLDQNGFGHLLPLK